MRRHHLIEERGTAEASGYFFRPGFDRQPPASHPGVGTLPAAKPAKSAAPRVLVVDDDSGIRQLLQRILERRFRATVCIAKDGIEAIEHLRGGPFELILCDIRMPRVSGVSLWDWVKLHCPGQANRFIFVTGDPGSQENCRKLEATRQNVLFKPFSLNDLESHCRQVLARS